VPYDHDTEAMRQAIAAFHPQPGKINILTAHCGIRGGKTGSEYMLDGELTPEDLRPTDFDQIILGHYHEPQQLAPNICYVGSLLQRSFSDVGAPRRALLFDTATGQLESIPLPGPRFVIVHLTRPLDEVPLVAEANTYYRVIVEHPSIEPKAIDSALEGIALGWVI